MSNKLQKVAPKWHDEAKHMLLENFERVHNLFTESTKRAVWMGMFLNHIKTRGKEDKSIPHGQFRNWLAANVPALSNETLATYMRLATGVCEKGKFQISDFLTFAKNGQLPPELAKLVEGKTQQQLFLEFKQVDDDDLENPNAKRGHNKGSKGLTKEMREKAKLRAEQDRINDLEEKIIENIDWLRDIADAKNLGMMDGKLIKRFCDACDTASGYGQTVIAARKEAK
jgi:hypothetical protein